MKIFNEEKIAIDRKKSKRSGRGISQGQGKTAGRGTKGQKSRAGHNIPRQFEGGQTNLSMRLPKIKGFRGKPNKTIIIPLDVINKNFDENDIVSRQSLIDKGLCSSHGTIKILANGTLTKEVIIEGINISASVQKMLNRFKSAGSANPSQNVPKTSSKTKK